MAQYGEWNRKGAVLSDKTAKKEYGVAQDFIIDGINVGKLEYRHGSAHGNPYIRILRSQLETYISESLGEAYLKKVTAKTELKKIKREITTLKHNLTELEQRKVELECLLGRC